VEDLPRHRRHQAGCPRGRSGWRAVHGPAHAGRRPGHPSSLHGFDRRHARRLAGRAFPGFQVLEEHGAPSWFELYARDYAAAVSFYQTVFRLEARSVADGDEFRYTTLRAEGSDVELAGIMDARTFLGEGVPSHWTTYWEVDDVDASVAKVRTLGGSVITDAADSPYGRIAAVADPIEPCSGCVPVLRNRLPVDQGVVAANSRVAGHSGVERDADRTVVASHQFGVDLGSLHARRQVLRDQEVVDAPSDVAALAPEKFDHHV